MDSNWLDHLDQSNEHQLDYSQRLFAKTLIFLAKTKLSHEFITRNVQFLHIWSIVNRKVSKRNIYRLKR